MCKGKIEKMELEAEYFANYWGIVDATYDESYADLDPLLQDSIVDLYKEIYSHMEYEVISCEMQRDGSYAVKIAVQPLDIMERVYNIYMNNEYEPMNQFRETYTEEVVTNLTDAEYMEYINEYGEVVVQMVSDQLDSIDYGEEKTQVIRVEEDADGYLAINDDDFAIFDSYVITYP